MTSGVQFQRVNAHCDRRGGVFPFLVIRCSTCPRTAKTAEDPDKPIGLSRACRAFTGMGWRVAAQRSADECPQCVAGLTKSPKRPAQPVAKPKGPAMVSTTTQDRTPAAAPPRQPSLSDIQKIRRALDEVYDDEAGRYRGADTDQSVAERLDVPRAWVSQERAHAYGPERCEADAQDVDALKQIVAMAGEVSAKHLELATSAEDFGRKAQRLIDKLAARGVQC